MKIDVLTGFPEMIDPVIHESMVKRAQEKGIVRIRVHDLRDYSADKKHRKTDDYPFGGGDGMVMTPQPLWDGIHALLKAAPDGIRPRVIFPTPDGRQFTQPLAEVLSKEAHLIFVCGHYKGIDQRIRDTLITDEITVGDYILTGGELPAMLIMDALIRLIPGVLSEINSALSDSFSQPLLDCPWYTRPEIFEGMPVPEVLLSGHHANIEEWRKTERIRKTKERRPDIWKAYTDKGDDRNG
ncbi:MAG: tRNA (guanosine(37)-N1)-methyltransferase TrmD [Candidatus Neomarinimicrobiota bacterium]|jgi:tRNA (guanine37-N1)-methyltransferase|nr:tRNA (guanosine(37)-N1)-methyltransferase TrmD [Candidatus Neomarinimicrobiota bacterium]MDD3965424.1 tRNA (guanosine(37)-N1)-methyltransferase TrmD [Candidatus Neomarinimicrobiota bacterium]